MKINKIDKIVLLLICLSLCVGFVTIYQRMNVEKQYKTAEIVLDYAEMEKYSDYTGNDLETVLGNFKKYGAQSVAIQEETINLLIESGHSLRAEIVSQLIKNYSWEKNYNQKIVSDINDGIIGSSDVVITTENEGTYDYVVTGLTDRYSQTLFDTYTLDDEFYIVLHGTNDDLYYGNTERIVNSDGEGVVEKKQVVDSRLLNIGIGYDDDKIEAAKSAGLDVILRPINYPANNEHLAEAYKEANERYGLIPRLYFVQGKEVIGYPGNESKLLNYINENNIASVLVESSNQREHIEQDGLSELVEKSNYKAVRAFTMWDYIRGRYKYYNYSGAEEIENTMFRAISERNIRIIYFKPFFTEEGGTKYLADEDEYQRTFDSLKDRLSEHDISLGKASVISEFHIGEKRLSIITFGITLAGVLLFIKMFNIKNRYVNYLYLVAIPGALVPLVMRNIAEKGFSLLAAIVFSGLAIAYLMNSIKNIYDSDKKYTNLQLVLKSVVTLATFVAIALAGAVFVDSMLADVKYFLEMDIFRGVKASQLLPFAVFLVMYLVYFMNRQNEDNLKNIANISMTILNKDIKIYYAVLAGIIGIVGYVYISRTGHETDLQPSTIEMICRNFMENVLLARPRTKEILIAFPAIFAAGFAANKKSGLFTCLFMLASAIGASDVINTFSHIRTPIYLSLTRTVIGLIFGIVIGCIVLLVLKYIYALYMKIQERLK